MSEWRSQRRRGLKRSAFLSADPLSERPEISGADLVAHPIEWGRVFRSATPLEREQMLLRNVLAGSVVLWLGLLVMALPVVLLGLATGRSATVPIALLILAYPISLIGLVLRRRIRLSTRRSPDQH
jgi:hypothetical protein